MFVGFDCGFVFSYFGLLVWSVGNENKVVVIKNMWNVGKEGDV